MAFKDQAEPRASLDDLDLTTRLTSVLCSESGEEGETHQSEEASPTVTGRLSHKKP